MFAVLKYQNTEMDYLDKAYKEFAENGMKGITQFVDKNDSLENLEYELLSLHVNRIDFLSSLIKKQNLTFDEFFELLVEYHDQIKFNKQLFTHRVNPEMNLCFLYGISVLKPITIPLFKSHFTLSEDVEYYDSVWMTMVESWYSALDVNNLTVKHIKDVSEETAEIIFKLNKYQLNL